MKNEEKKPYYKRNISKLITPSIYPQLNFRLRLYKPLLSGPSQKQNCHNGSHSLRFTAHRARCTRALALPRIIIARLPARAVPQLGRRATRHIELRAKCTNGEPTRKRFSTQMVSRRRRALVFLARAPYRDR